MMSITENLKWKYILTLTRGNSLSPNNCFFSWIGFPSKEATRACASSLLSLLAVAWLDAGGDGTEGGATIGIAFVFGGGVVLFDWLAILYTGVICVSSLKFSTSINKNKQTI